MVITYMARGDYSVVKDVREIFGLSPMWNQRLASFGGHMLTNNFFRNLLFCYRHRLLKVIKLWVFEKFFFNIYIRYCINLSAKTHLLHSPGEFASEWEKLSL